MVEKDEKVRKKRRNHLTKKQNFVIINQIYRNKEMLKNELQ